MQRDILSPHVVTKPTTKPTSQHAHTPNSVYSPTRTPLESLSRCLTHSLALALFLAVYALSLSQLCCAGCSWCLLLFCFALLLSLLLRCCVYSHHCGRALSCSLLLCCARTAALYLQCLLLCCCCCCCCFSELYFSLLLSTCVYLLYCSRGIKTGYILLREK